MTTPYRSAPTLPPEMPLTAQEQAALDAQRQDEARADRARTTPARSVDPGGIYVSPMHVVHL